MFKYYHFLLFISFLLLFFPIYSYIMMIWSKISISRDPEIGEILFYNLERRYKLIPTRNKHIKLSNKSNYFAACTGANCWKRKEKEEIG